MKLISISDLHLSSQTPTNRQDDHTITCLRKLRQVIDYTNEHGDILIIAGDLFDKPSNPVWFINRVIAEFSRLWRPVVVIPGNHDLPQHNIDIVKDSSLWTLHIAEAVKVYPHGSFEFAPNSQDEKWVTLHTCPYGADPSTLRPVPGHYNVLIAHIPVFESTVPFYMLDGITVDQLEQQNLGHDLYLVGDIHDPAIKGKTIVTGSMVRRTVAQKNFQPAFWVIDTETDERSSVPFKIEADVWKTGNAVIEDDSYKAELADLAETLRQRAEKPDYSAVISQLAGQVPDLGSTINSKIQGYIDEYSRRT